MASENLSNIEDDVREATEVVEGATIFINGVAAQIDAAVQKAIAGGATAEQLAPVSALSDALEAKVAALSAALVANTPAANP